MLTWNYKAQNPSIRHVGPVAQDFAKAFHFGEDNKHISTVDAEGVNLAATQALYKLTQKQNRELKSTVAVQGKEIRLLARQVALLQKRR
jgi:hypothetical protein